MTEAPDSNGASGRDGAGRFTLGNRYSVGGGNPNVRRLGALQAAVRDAVDADGLRDVLRTLHAAAVGGDVSAAALLLSRTLGKPREEPSEAPGLELGDLSSAAGCASASAAIAAAAAAGTVEPDVAATLATLVGKAAELGALRDLETRIAELEKRS